MCNISIYSNAKPILFNTDMVKAILSDKKCCTRRIAKIPTNINCHDGKSHNFIRDDFAGYPYTGYVCQYCGYGVSFPHSKYPIGSSFIRPRYNIGDILYVRETWRISKCEMCENPVESYQYLASVDERYKDILKWKPSIHMPKDAARLFLRVTNVRLERLQDITETDAEREGFERQDHRAAVYHFAVLWDKTVSQKDRDVFGWDANPWVWVYEFKKI